MFDIPLGDVPLDGTLRFTLALKFTFPFTVAFAFAFAAFGLKITPAPVPGPVPCVFTGVTVHDDSAFGVVFVFVFEDFKFLVPVAALPSGPFLSFRLKKY